MRCLITGGAGFIGRHLVAALAAAGGYELRVLDDDSTGDRRALAGSGAAFVQGDLRDRAALDAALPGCTAVIHLAAATGVAACTADPRRSLDVNAMGTLELLEGCRRHGVLRVIAASTAGALLDADGGVVDAHRPARPQSPYGAGKAALEALLSAYAGSFGLETCALRLGNVYGPGASHKDGVVLRFLRAHRAGRPPVIHGDGEQARDFVYVLDVVAGIRQALDSGAQGTFQLGSGRPTTLRELVAVLDEVLVPGPLPAIHVPRPSGEAGDSHCDIAPAHEAFGYVPHTPLVTGLARTWAWVRAGEPAGAGA